MKKQVKILAIIFFIMLYSLFSYAQNVGINQPNPQQALDVNGNINTTGTIMANGNEGQAGQMLVKNSSNNLAWADACAYKNFESITSLLTTTWTPPAGVTKILVEAWGSGGGGNMYAGGGGGGYIKALFDITPTSVISLAIGDGGSFGNGTSDGITGTVTTFSVTNGSTQTITAFGGGGGLYSTATTSEAGYGGSYSRTSNLLKYIGLDGESGYSLQKHYYQYNATTFYENGIAGHGGNAANSQSTGGLGQSYLLNTTSGALIQIYANPKVGKIPGGGGAGGYYYNTSTTSVNSSGGVGANGMIIIRY
jgi:hypothetical protein